MARQPGGSGAFAGSCPRGSPAARESNGLSSSSAFLSQPRPRGTGVHLPDGSRYAPLTLAQSALTSSRSARLPEKLGIMSLPSILGSPSR
eukprot:5060503-Prymnesium_polylepis.2